jgi:hypothetical protein
MPERLIKAAIDRLLGLGLLEMSGRKSPRDKDLASQANAAIPQGAAPKPHRGATEGNGREHHHHKEEKQQRREPKRRELQGTEAPTADATSDGSSESRADESSLSQNADDDEQSPEKYASPEDNLKAIYLAKANEHIAIDLLDAIRANVECAGGTMADFVSLLKKHIAGNWLNPPGFVRHLSQRYRSKTRVAGAPVTAAEAAAKNYRCEICSSKTPGEGIVFADDKFAPCSCASPEYIERERARGTFPPET